MSFAGILRMLGRRWYLLPLVMILAVAGGVAGHASKQPMYESRAQLLLLPSAGSAVSTGGTGVANPYLNLYSSLQQTVQIVSAQMMDANSADAVYDAGVHSRYLVAPDTTLLAPVVSLTTTDASAAETISSLNKLIAMFNTQLEQIQLSAGAPKDTLLHSATMTLSPKPQRLVKPQITRALMGGMLGLLIGLGAIALLERWSRARQSRREAEEPVDPLDEAINELAVGAVAKKGIEQGAAKVAVPRR